MLTLVYVSSATELLTEHELLELLRHSRRNNAELGITGLLLHIGGNFMQALEGPDEAVEALYNRIGADPRHRQVRTILRMASAHRMFSDWNMGFQEAASLPPEVQGQVSSFIDDAQHSGGRAADQVSPVLMLLRGFARTMR
ncbi:MAG: BLUF domain-containing protein [Alphaproteobacteria bacterium]|nr:BLUF domain-containing protein [Alphaproteobacteria bacterium]